MNKVIEVLKSRRTRRSFIKGEVISKDDLETIIECAKQAPTWMNGQHYSIVVVNDSKVKDEIAQISGNNKNHIENSGAFVLFYADFNNIKLAGELENEKIEIADNYEALITATTDAALAMENAVIAAESLGYGTVCCGAVRNVGKQIAELLNVPKNAFLVCGLSIGVVDKELSTEKVKPRLPHSANVGYNEFPNTSKKDLEEYVETMVKFAEARETKTWTKKFADFYSLKPLEKNTKEVLKEQGFIK